MTGPIRGQYSHRRRGEGDSADVFRGPEHLLVDELPGLLVNVVLVQVGGQGHEPHLTQAKVRELDVAHGGDQEVQGGDQEVQVPIPNE